MDKIQESRDIKALIEILYTVTNYTDFSAYSKFTPFTNEKIYSFFQEISPGENALSVLASGDQMFDLILKGYRDFTTFDINRFAEYYVYGLKMSAVKELDYNSYKVLFGLDFEKSKNLLRYITDYIPEQYRKFWIAYQRIMENRIGIGNVLCGNLTGGSIGITDGMINTCYCHSEREFNKLKRLLPLCTFEHQVCDIMCGFPGEKIYDLIYLSNILDYQEHNCYHVLKQLYKQNLRDRGELTYTGFTNPTFHHPFLSIRQVEYNDDWNFYVIQKLGLKDARTRKIEYKKTFGGD